MTVRRGPDPRDPSSGDAAPRDDGRMLDAVRGLPDQIDATWARRAALALPWSRERFDNVVVLGMGGSAIGGDLVANLLADRLPVPVVVVRDDRPPGWVGTRTLVVGISVSGQTAETLAAWNEALGRGCAAIAITRGGALAESARAADTPLVLLPDGGPPRAALGHTFTWCAAVLEHLGLAAGVGPLLAEATAAMRRLVALDAATADGAGADGDGPTAARGGTSGPGDAPAGAATPAAIAARIDGAVPILYVPAALEAVGRRWKAQLNENAKVAAGYDCAPELHHNTVVAYENAPNGVSPLLPTLLRPAAGDAAMALTARLLDDLGLPHADVRAPSGLSWLAQGLWLVQFGDLVSVRLAYRRGVDPTPIEAITRIKALRATAAG